MVFDNLPRRGISWFSVLFYLILGLYFLNYPLGLIPIPEFIASIDKWIIFIGGIFMLIGAVNSIRIGRGYAG